jgi:hypothetical protein
LQAADMTAGVQNTNVAMNYLDNSSDQLYRNMEVNLEAFGMGTVDEHGGNIFDGNHYSNHVRGGVGAGLEFFMWRYIGIEGEAWSETTHHSFVNDAGGNLVLRWPIGNTGLSPYIFGGGGYQWLPGQTTYEDGGAGLEFRFTPMIGIFADARFVTADKTSNYGMGRLGVKFSF